MEINNQVISNLVRTYDLQNYYLDEDKTWSGILASTDFVVRSTCHTTLQATQYQLVFGREKILNTPFVTDLEAIWLGKKRKRIDKSNQIKNKNRKMHIYRILDKVLAHNKKASNHEDTDIGHDKITQVWTNGNATIPWGVVQEHINII